MARVPSEGAVTHRQAVYAVMSEGVLVYDQTGRCIDANPAAEHILGLTRDEILGNPANREEWLPIAPDGAPLPGSEHPVFLTLRTGVPVVHREMAIRSPQAPIKWLRVSTQAVGAGTDATAADAVVAVFTDITEFKEITNHLRQSQADLEAILDNLPARISSFNVDGRNRFANCTAERRMGFASDGAKGRTVREIMGDAWYADYKSHVEGALAGQRQRFRTLERQPDGSTRYSQVEYVPASRDSGEGGFYSLAVDITEQELSHERIRHLVQRMATVREDERRVIAQTLHEGIAQELFAVKLGLANLTAAGNLAPSKLLCSGLASAIDNCMAEIRQIANDLRPCGLPHSNVAATIREYARQFAAMCGLSIRVSELQAFPELDEPKRLAFYRAAQEALTNVARHARATQIDIVLRADGPLLTMDVLDDGVGIDDAAIGQSGSLGLLGIRERFESIHGALTVRRNQGAGTTFSVSLPAPQQPHAVNHVRNQPGIRAR